MKADEVLKLLEKHEPECADRYKRIEQQLDKLQSCIVNSVHDSIVIDIHPNEVQQVIDIIKIVNDNMIALINSAFALEFNVPLLLEAKIGNNWLDTKDVM